MIYQEALTLVLAAARRRSIELLNQASAYERRGMQSIADETMREHYQPLADAIEMVEAHTC